MKKRLLYMLSAATALCMGLQSFAQGSSEYNAGLKLKINEDGSKYIRFIVWNQMWARYIQNNPGTTVAGTPENNTFDLGARRLRFLAYAQISPRYLILTHIGINNQTFTNGGVAGAAGTGGYGLGKKPGLFFHDVWNEYAVIPSMKPGTKEANKFSLYAGMGLHYWHGVSRMTNGSTLNFLAVDAPIFNWTNIETSDQFARQFGVYFKGKAGKLDYRVAVNRPFATTQVASKKTLDVAVENNKANKWAYQGYFMYQFLDQEANVLPFTVGTYVGTKKVFNIGAGFYTNPKGSKSYHINTPGDTALIDHNITQFGVDVFADIPFGGEKNMAFTGYSVLYNLNYGPNYLRNTGIMNVADATKDPAYTGDVSSAGFGNARPLLGTGNIWYTQAGLLLPKTISKKVRIQPFAAYTFKKFDAHEKSMNYFDAGANFFLDGHHSKVTVQYSTRPLIKDGASNGSRGEIILQTQVYL